MSQRYSFPEVTLLITHYNRSSSLDRLLKAFQDLNCTFGEIIVSDDGSKPEHLNRIHSMTSYDPVRVITTPQNKGLGNNINKGQDAVKTPLTLYVQEDFVPEAIFPDKLQRMLEIFKTREDLDIIRFYAYFKYPYMKPISDGFSEMKFSIWYPGYKKFYMYSDHPHLRRSNFLQKFGRYDEGVKGDVTEYRMMMRFLKRKGKGLFYDDFKGLFDQRNNSEEPSTMKRNFWRESANPFVTLARHCYRYIRFNWDYLL